MTLRVLCGAEPRDSHHLRYMQLLRQAGVEVHLIDHSVVFRREPLPVASHARWPRSGRRSMSAVFGRTVGNGIADWAITQQLRSTWRRSRADLCHIHWVDDRLDQCAKAGLRPLVATAYGSDLNGTRRSDFDPSLLESIRSGLGAVDLFIADSDDMIALASELAGRELRSLLLPIGVSTSLFRPGFEDQAAQWRSKLCIPASTRVILSPRVIAPPYRHDAILRAFAAAVRDYRIDAVLVLKSYLADASHLGELRTLASQLGIAERIRIIDEVPYERLPILYAMADFAVNYPRMDAFPVTFLECLACELPILTNSLPAYSSNGIGQYLTFVADQMSALATGLRDMCNGGAASAPVDEARMHIVRNLGESAFTDRLLTAYEQVSMHKAVAP